MNRLVAITILLLLASASIGFAADAQTKPAAKAVAYDVHSGYFVSNQFEPDEKASFVVLTTQEQFDKVFGSAYVMRDKSHRLPPGALESQSRMVVAAIKRGKAVYTFKVEKLEARGDTLTLSYTVKAAPQKSAEFACPLIVSLDKGDYAKVVCVENDKTVKTIDLAPAKAASQSAETTAAQTDDPGVKAIASKEKDKITAAIQDGRTVLDITSNRGIGKATITRTGDHWPAITLRLHLQGLESLKISDGEVSLNLSVLSHSGNKQLLHYKDNIESPQLTKESPYWTQAVSYDKSGKPVDGLPPAGGWFAVQIPKAMLKDESQSIKIEWIDFFRG